MSQQTKQAPTFMKRHQETFTTPHDKYVLALIVAVFLACCFAGCSPAERCVKGSYKGCYTGKYRLSYTGTSNSGFSPVASQSL